MAELTHFNDGTRWAACGAKKRAPLTDDPARVACTECRSTKAWSTAWHKRLEGMRS